MLDPNTATFEETHDPETNRLIVVGQLAATQAVTIDGQKLAASDVPRATLLAEAKRALLIMLWKQCYGELGSGIEEIHQHARQVGSLATLAITRPLRELLRPEVPAPAPETETPPEEPEPLKATDPAVEAFVGRLLVRLQVHGIAINFSEAYALSALGDEPEEILANAIAKYIVTLPPPNHHETAQS